MEAQVLPRTGRLFLPRSPQVLAAFSDERLVEQVRRGNEAAFEAVYDRHHRGILAFCRHMLGSQVEAEDAVQQTFVSAYGDLVSSDKPIKLKAWLYTIARNRCLSTLRSCHEQATELVDVPTAGLSDAVLERDELRRLLADVAALPWDQRAALVLAEFRAPSHAEIAEIVGCHVLKVKSLVFQARSSLIESRAAQEIPCVEIRKQIATLRGGALRRGSLRRHLRACPACSEYRDSVRRQRQMLSLVLPVTPSARLKYAGLTRPGTRPTAPRRAACRGGGGGRWLRPPGQGRRVRVVRKRQLEEPRARQGQLELESRQRERRERRQRQRPRLRALRGQRTGRWRRKLGWLHGLHGFAVHHHPEQRHGAQRQRNLLDLHARADGQRERIRVRKRRVRRGRRRAGRPRTPGPPATGAAR